MEGPGGSMVHLAGQHDSKVFLLVVNHIIATSEEGDQDVDQHKVEENVE